MSEQEKLKEQIKHKLHAYVDREHERKQLADRLTALETSATSPRTQAMDGMPRGSGGGDAMTSIVAELVGLQEKYRAKLLQLTRAQAEVEDMIGSLDDPIERRLMRYRYIVGMVWEEVCVEMNYSWRQTHRIHSAVLDKLVAAEMGKQEVTANV